MPLRSTEVDEEDGSRVSLANLLGYDEGSALPHPSAIQQPSTRFATIRGRQPTNNKIMCSPQAPPQLRMKGLAGDNHPSVPNRPVLMSIDLRNDAPRWRVRSEATYSLVKGTKPPLWHRKWADKFIRLPCSLKATSDMGAGVRRVRL